MKTLAYAYFALCAACFAGSYDQARTGALTTNGGTVSGELIVDSDQAAAGGQYSYPLSFVAGSGTNSIYAFDDRLFLLATGQALYYSNQIVTIGTLAEGITNGIRIGSASFVLDQNGALAANWNAGGQTISNATFIGDGSGLTGISGGGGASSKTMGGQAANWSILSAQASNLTYGSTSGVTYINFDMVKGGGYVDTRRILVSNLTFSALYLSGYANGATGTAQVVFRGHTDGGTTGEWHIAATDSVFELQLTNAFAPLGLYTLDWGIVGGTATNDVRINAATLNGVWE